MGIGLTGHELGSNLRQLVRVSIGPDDFNMFKRFKRFILICLLLAVWTQPGTTQVPPSASDVAAYQGLHRAAAAGEIAALRRELVNATTVDARDASQRTPFHVAAYFGKREAMSALVAAGADPNALEFQAYDAVTIAAVADDVETLKVALALGNKATNITSPYDGTALIAAAHLGNDEVVRLLIEAGAPINHVNNLGWTALIEAIVLGDGGPRHQACVRHLLKAGASRTIADRYGTMPIDLARQRGFVEMVKLLEN
jgi:uncharacterized protein